jgi:hypothetical protein
MWNEVRKTLYNIPNILVLRATEEVSQIITLYGDKVKDDHGALEILLMILEGYALTIFFLPLCIFLK